MVEPDCSKTSTHPRQDPNNSISALEGSHFTVEDALSRAYFKNKYFDCLKANRKREKFKILHRDDARECWHIGQSSRQLGIVSKEAQIVD